MRFLTALYGVYDGAREKLKVALHQSWHQSWHTKAGKKVALHQSWHTKAGTKAGKAGKKSSPAPKLPFTRVGREPIKVLCSRDFRTRAGLGASGVKLSI